jgi:hypothetical protein
MLTARPIEIPAPRRTRARSFPAAGRVCLLVAAFLLTGPVGCGDAGVETVRIVSPQERQVFQRDADGGADVDVHVVWREGEAGLEVRARLADGDLTGWQPLGRKSLDGEAVHLAATIRLPAGGWHALELRRTQTGDTWEAVRRVGVGEVFVVAGQSNSTNCGEAPMPGGNDKVSAFDGRRWHLATDPMPGVQDGTTGGSPWPVLGDLLQRSLDLPVAIASAGHAGSSVRDWQPDRPQVSRHIDQPLYPAFRDRVMALGSVRAVLWHQGEADASRSLDGEAYYRNFRRLQQGLERDVGRPLTWVVARATFVRGVPPEQMEPIRRAQERIWREGLALQGPSTDELRGNLRGKDRTHFSRRGLRVHAELWHAALWAQLFSNPPLRPSVAPPVRRSRPGAD